MASKKLKADLELENAKAKQATEELGDAVENSFGDANASLDKLIAKLHEALNTLIQIANVFNRQGGNGVRAIDYKPKSPKGKEMADEASEEAADAFSRMADAAGKTADGLNVSSKTLLRVAGSFGGMLAGTAARAIALKQPDGSPAQKALDWGGGALQGAGQGAMMGSLFGPLGTAIGALAGAANALMNKFIDEEEAEQRKRKAIEETNAANRELVDSMLAAEERTDKFRTMIENLGDTERSLAERQAEVAAEIEKRIEEEKLLKSGMKSNSGKFADEANQKNLRQNIKEYQANHAELVRLQQLQKSLAESPKASGAGEQVIFSAVDSLSRVGGAFSAGDSGFRDLQRTNEQQLKVLEKIEAKTGAANRGGTF